MLRSFRPALARVVLASLATLAIGGVTAGRADAGRVVVLSVAGEGGAEYEDLLVNALTDEHRVMDSRDVDAAARRAGLDDADPDSLGPLARDLDADVVIDAMIARDRRAHLLTIRIRDRDGTLWRKMTVTIAARRLGRGGIRAVRERLLAEVDALLAEQARRDGGRRRDTAREATRERVGARDRARDRDVDRAREPEPRRDRGTSADDGDDPDLDLDGENPLAGESSATGPDDAAVERRRREGRRRPDPRRPPLVIDVGPAAMNRTLDFEGEEFAQMPRGYQGAFVPAARVAGELYPIGFANRASPAAGLGFYGDYARVLKLTTRSSDATTIALPTQQVRWEVGLRFRYAFGSRPTYPSVALSVGYGRRAFTVDRTPLAGQTLDLPDVDYEVITPGLGLRVPLGTWRFALTAGGRFLAVRSTGPIQSPNEYGAAKMTGVDAEAGFDLAITRQVVLKARGELSRFGYDFEGNGAQTRNRDMDPADQDIAGAADQWVSASATIGFAF